MEARSMSADHSALLGVFGMMIEVQDGDVAGIAAQCRMGWRMCADTAESFPVVAVFNTVLPLWLDRCATRFGE
jgi:hypothetical protein